MPSFSSYQTPSASGVSGRVLRWANGLVLAGTVLLFLTLVLPGSGLFTIVLIPSCFYLSWLGYVAAWPVPRSYQWAMVVSALAAHAVLFWMMDNGFLKSALVCGIELIVAVGWQRWQQATGRWVGAAALGLWLVIAYAGLKHGSLHEAVRHDDEQWVAALLASGANANATVEGQPVLHEALSWRASPVLIRRLLRHGANPNAYWKRPDGSIVQPVAFAFPSGADPDSAHAVLRLLLAANLNPCQTDQHGRNFRQNLPSWFHLTPTNSTALALAERRHGCP